MVSLTTASTTTATTTTQVSSTDSTTTSSGSSSSSTTTPSVDSFELLPFYQTSLVNLGLVVPKNGDDLDALLGEVTMVLQAAAQQAQDNKANNAADAANAAMAQVEEILAQAQNLNSQMSTAASAAAQDQSDISAGFQLLASVNTGSTSYSSAQIAALEAALSGADADIATLNSASPTSASYANALTDLASQEGVFLEIESTQSYSNQMTKSDAEQEIASGIVGLENEATTIVNDQTQVAGLVVNLAQADEALATIEANQQGAMLDQNNATDQSLSSMIQQLISLPQLLQQSSLNTSLKQALVEDEQNQDSVNAAAIGLAVGVIGACIALSEIASCSTNDPQLDSVQQGTPYQLTA